MFPYLAKPIEIKTSRRRHLIEIYDALLTCRSRIEHLLFQLMPCRELTCWWVQRRTSRGRSPVVVALEFFLMLMPCFSATRRKQINYATFWPDDRSLEKYLVWIQLHRRPPTTDERFTPVFKVGSDPEAN